MEIDSDIFIIDEYLNSHLSLPLQKIIFSYIKDMFIEYMRHNELILMDWILRKLYEIKYLNKYNNLRNEFDKDCINDNKQIIINFKQNRHYVNLINHLILISKLENILIMVKQSLSISTQRKNMNIILMIILIGI